MRYFAHLLINGVILYFTANGVELVGWEAAVVPEREFRGEVQVQAFVDVFDLHSDCSLCVR